MDAKNSVVVAQQLVSDLEGLTNSNSHSHSNSGPASKGSLRHSHQLPSLQQFYRLGLLLFRIQEPSKHGKQNETDPVSIAYRQLIARIPEELLRPVFADLLRALKALISGFDKDRRLSSSVSKSGNRPSRGNGNGNGNANSDGDIGLEDLALAVRSVAGLVGALSKDNDAACSTSCSRLCGLVYDPSWVSALASVYDQLVVAERKQQHQSTATASTTGTGTGTGTGIQHHKKTVLACLSRLLLDGLVLAAHPPSREYSSSTTLCVEESLLEAIRAMEEESTDCLRDLQAWQASSEPLGRTLEESLCIADRKPTHKNDGDDDDALERAQQREYIASMLESARSQPSSMAISQQASAFGTPLAARSQQVTMTSSSSSSSKPATNPAETELDRRIQQVLQILPHFGEGFVEVALGIHKGDTEATVATLLDDPSNYPTALRVLDAKLPRRKREFRAYQTAAEEQASAQQARADVKERMAQEERRKIAEYEALVVASSSEAGQGAGAGEASVSSVAASDQNQSQNQNQNHKAKPPLSRKELRQQKLKQKLRRAMNEYDDDYDDQYDDVDVKLGATDDGFTADQSSARNANANGNSMTLEQVKLYNKIVQEDESDASFWESNRNTNRPTTNKGKGKGNSGNDDDDDPEENGGTQKQWGRDKIKGGRTIGEDGRIVRKPGGVRKKKNHNTNQQPTKSNNNNNNSNSNSSNSANKKKGPGGNKSNNNNNNNNNNSNAGSGGINNNNNNNANKKKPRTKPKSDNRVNRQRDRKMTKHGTFGVQD
eukprot:CAMPEP_0172409110 /NCGR_PEP_ID=MMETSP1061-20121228/76198_1 /TAXON_ID=37318 /ORGANISM="Pseudo-nitzschia pungens, Strain cf. pungens" /LENGTH=774 /DNA_ID=CAMNT_0013145257 /DNA_START=113 /DNA_END=2437 /DNA_ORIENTATION=-